MKNIIKIILASMGIITFSTHAATVQQLLTQKEDILTLLQEYWVDATGNMRIANKDATAQFSFNKNLIEKMTDVQLKNAMNQALARFTSEQQTAFKTAVSPLLDDLTKVKTAIAAEQKKMEDAAKTIGSLLNKTQQNVMSLADQNLKTLISNITDGQKKITAYQQPAILSPLRKEFGIETSDTLASTKPKSGDTDIDGEQKLSKETLSAKQKIAQGVANTNFKVSGMAGFIGETIKYGHCRDRHFDIVTDSEGLHFITEAR